MAVVVGNVSHPKLQGLRLRQFYITSIADGDTLDTGIPNIREVAMRTGTGSSATPDDTCGASGDSACLAYLGTLAATRRPNVHISDAAYGRVVFYSPTGSATGILMVWSRA